MYPDAGEQQPRGLYVAAATEAWERFSYYGMSALVMLYMVEALFRPERISSVHGLAHVQAVLGGLYGPLSPQALASQIFGLYAGLVYLTPLLGGYVADRLLGVRRTVLAGLVLLTCGHFLMAFENHFLVALLLLVLGSGFVKGNLSAQVGSLYPPGEQARRTRGFALMSMSVNIGAVCGPLACGAAVQAYGWHAGFGVAATLMLTSLVIYVLGGKLLPDVAVRRTGCRRGRPAPGAHAIVGLLLIVIAVSLFQTIVYSQLFNTGLVWISEHVDRSTPFGRIPTPWFTSIDALASIASAPLLMRLWKAQAARGKEPDPLEKMAIGAALTGLQALVLALAAAIAGPGRVGAVPVILVLMSAGIAFNFHWPPLVALISLAAPKAVNATMINTTFLTFFVGNLAAGQIAMLYQPLGPAAFWLLNAAIACAGVPLALVLRRPFAALAPSAAAPRDD